MKLYRFRYSSFARKVQMLLGLLGRRHELIDVKYGDRTALAELTGGYIYVPVLVDDDGGVHVESRQICEHLLRADGADRFVPSPLEGPVWAYSDFCDEILEDVLFRIASPHLRATWTDAGERALYTLIKERKFGAGCIDAWAAAHATLVKKAQSLLAPSVATLSKTPFVFGSKPTLADAALYGNLAMLHEAKPALVREIAPSLAPYMARVEAAQLL